MNKVVAYRSLDNLGFIPGIIDIIMLYLPNFNHDMFIKHFKVHMYYYKRYYNSNHYAILDMLSDIRKVKRLGRSSKTFGINKKIRT